MKARVSKHDGVWWAEVDLYPDQPPLLTFRAWFYRWEAAIHWALAAIEILTGPLPLLKFRAWFYRQDVFAGLPYSRQPIAGVLTPDCGRQPIAGALR